MDRRQFCQGAFAAAASFPFSNSHAIVTALQALSQITSNINAVAGDGKDIVIEKAALQELSDSLRGNLLLTGSEAYEKARRVLNPSIDKYPAFVVQPSGVSDIQNAVTFAQERGLLVAVKCGGHSYGGKSTCDGGMQIDLSLVRGVRVDPKSRTAYVEGGSLLGDLDHEAMAQGLVTTAGTVSHTGVGGLTLGGGFGRLARRYGLALDNIKSVDIVTADGQLRRASADENPDLYWGVRGGGGNFGIVTNFEFGLHPMQRDIIGGSLMFPISKAQEVLKVYAEYSANAPDELYTDFVMIHPPEGGDAVVVITLCYSGDAGKADAIIAPLKRLGEPLVNTIGVADYVTFQKQDDNTDPRTGGDYMKSGFTRDINDGLIQAVPEFFEPDPDRLTWMFFQHAGGAIGRFGAEETAFAHRYASHVLAVVATWNRGVDHTPHFAYARNYWKELEPYTRGFYTNEISDETQTVVNANYQGNFDRLLSIKEKYDPTNLFRLNANIRQSA